MIASKFVKCITKLLNLNSYHLLPNSKNVCNPKFITTTENGVNEAEKSNIEKLCANLDLENKINVRNCNLPLCKSDISLLKGNNLYHPPTCHSAPCCNLFEKTLDQKIKVSTGSLTEEKSTRSQSTSTTPLKECKSAIYILHQRKHDVPIKPFSAPCRDLNHDEAVRKLCEKAMKTCSEARKIIYFYKHHMLEQVEKPVRREYEINDKTDFKLEDKPQNLVTETHSSHIILDKTPCPYCTKSSSISQNYSCPFCAKSVKNCTCIHCPHCKKSRITAPCKKSNQSNTKFFKFDTPVNCPLTGITNPLNTTLQDKIKMFAEKHNPCDFKIEDESFPVCKISKPKGEKLSLSKSENQKKRPKNSIEKHHKTKSLSHEGKGKSTNKKLQKSHIKPLPQPICKTFDKEILEKEDCVKNLPSMEEQKLSLPWMPAYLNEAKNCDTLLSQLLSPVVTKARNSIKKQTLGEHLENAFKSSEKKVKIHAKQKNAEKKLKGFNTPEVLKQTKEGKVRKKTIDLEKKCNSSSACSVKLIYPIKANRALSLNSNTTFSRHYCSKQDGSQPRDVLCDCPDAIREIGKCENMEYDEYFGDCYKNREYFKYDKYSYFTFEECMMKKRLPQPNSLDKEKECE